MLAGAAGDVEERSRVRASLVDDSLDRRRFARVVLERVLEVVELGARGVLHAARECDDFVPIANGHLRPRTPFVPSNRCVFRSSRSCCSLPQPLLRRPRCRAAPVAVPGAQSCVRAGWSRRASSIPRSRRRTSRRRSAGTAGPGPSGRLCRTRTPSRRKALRQYRLRGPPSAFQEDHLISLELGGDPVDPRNLWPEPYPRASAVDRIENDLNHRVCTGSLSLADAQRRESALKHEDGLTAALLRRVAKGVRHPAQEREQFAAVGSGQRCLGRPERACGSGEPVVEQGASSRRHVDAESAAVARLGRALDEAEASRVRPPPGWPWGCSCRCAWRGRSAGAVPPRRARRAQFAVTPSSAARRRRRRPGASTGG